VTSLDPAAAAAAYVQRLPAAALAAAPAQTAWTETLLAASVAVALLAALTVARLGVLKRIRGGLEAAGRPAWMTDAACAGAATGLVGLALALLAPISAAHAGGAGRVPAALIAALRQAAMFGLAGVLFAPPLYALMRRLPRIWAPLLGSLAALATFAALWLPFAEASGPANLPPAPAGSARDGLMRLISDTGLRASEVYVSANPAIDADVTGAGAARVVISHGLWTRASTEEMRASVGHLIGHHAHHDQLSIAVLLAILTLGLVMAVRHLTRPVASAVGLRVQGPADPLAAPGLIAVAIAYLCLALVADHAFIRWINVRADQYSLDHAREPDGLAQALLHEWKGEAVDPSPLQEALFYDHPALQGRLEHAMRWKAAHPG